ncbi:MAG: single-stranded-DNA-specific exonuclease RecJ [Coriobacteriales bacterium]|nr:single-stranded-DNA-specific exonuclease RecJ [Coriobacteriales bacterium]
MAIEEAGEYSGLSPLTARLLSARGFKTAQEIEEYLHPDLARDWSDPLQIPGMAEACRRVVAALRDRQRIMVFGDFDVDGLTACALTVRGLRSLGADPDYLIPNRWDDGYGLTAGALGKIFSADPLPELVITVDCGITARLEVEQLRQRGIDVVVTDHHEPGDLIPEGIAVTDPKLLPTSPSVVLAGVGVALKLIAAVGAEMGQEQLYNDLIDLAAIGTVADMVPLTGENRSLVHAGLQRLNDSPRPGIAAALPTGGKQQNPLSSSDISYTLIPRLNAAGRMGDPQLALQLLLDDNPVSAGVIAQKLDALNQQRRQAEEELRVMAIRQVEEGFARTGAVHPPGILIVSGPDWHEGVRGIVASRLVSRYGVPAIVFSEVDGLAKGSGRSIGSVNLYKAVEDCAELTERFGGHEAAVGVTVSCSKLPEFINRMQACMAAAPLEDFQPRLQADLEVGLEELSVQAAGEIQLLEPFGQDNQQPLFSSPDLLIKTSRRVGGDGRHLSLQLTDNHRTVPGIWFNPEDIESFIDSEDRYHALYTLLLDEWRGNRSIKLNIKSLQGCLQRWRQSALRAPETLGARIASQLLPAGRELYPAQQECLDSLKQDRSLLAVMGTGRGKSLIFQIEAIRRSLLAEEVSIFVYPLRALIADQAQRLEGALRLFGLSLRVLTGESSAEQRQEAYAQLNSGACNLVLTTPEFLLLHHQRFQECRRIGFLVIDEAHHVLTEQAGGREAYAQLGRFRGFFPQAAILACTATAPPAAARAICQALRLDSVVVDRFQRKNLNVLDLRNCDERNEALFAALSQGTKAIIYVNSRNTAGTLLHDLRKRFPERGARMVFYQARLDRGQRLEIERQFRLGEVELIVSTSAFGEGIDIADIGRVVLFHLPFSEIEFNQLAGRAGRNGQPAQIVLLYGEADAQINEAIFASLGIGDADAQRPAVQPDSLPKDESRQLECQNAYNRFKAFKQWAFTATEAQLLAQIVTPIDPTEERLQALDG